MAATEYDSDSTDDDFTETNVLLGFATKDGDADTISKLGGTPDWLDADDTPSAALVRCQACKELMVLLLQLNGELPDRLPGHERRLYVFACRRSGCRRKEGSVCVLRGVKIWEMEEAVEGDKAQGGDYKTSNQEAELGETLFGVTAMGNANPFTMNPHPLDSAASNPFGAPPSFSNITKPEPTISASDREAVSCLSKTFAESLALNVTPPFTAASPGSPPHEAWPVGSARPKPYPTFYISEAEYETLDPSVLAPKHMPIRLDDADAPEPSVLDREAFESSMDVTFQKFADRLVQNPDQVIRYEFAGPPLLYSTVDAVGIALTGVGIPNCPNCGAARVFELQLMPNAIVQLEEGESSLEGMEWGTIIVGVCQSDCAPRGAERGKAGYLREWVGVQWEELIKHK
ncbi:hypothetical protein CDD81_4275 [Ophiocordyceps australis]|uniref:Programmed cell death protein 2 C-terminal domain-containing protein n=1 Tax=Ophiocordyceps australis TaxID=1399860 RepID=A0A2C5X712_9HYPO|nr:hypothetical protein CDD81_4275 [Ophiocordyceps australis]